MVDESKKSVRNKECTCALTGNVSSTVDPI